MVSFSAIKSELSIVELSIFGTYFITKFSSSLSLTIILLYKLL